MKIVRPYAKLIFPPHVGDIDEAYQPLHYIEWCGRISHRSEEKQTPETWRRFIETVVLGHGDWSIVEHVTASVDMLVDRGITHELVRHRLFSYTQESTRFVNYEKKMPPSFVYPKPEIECELCLSGSESHRNDDVLQEPWQHWLDGGMKMVDCAYDSTWLNAIWYSEIEYKGLIQKGWRPQEARSVFPNALASRIIVTGNLRNFRHLFIMRTTQEAHPQMRQVMIPLLAEFKSVFPIIFDDLEPNARQVENLRKPR
jgi:thymidylate synthase (FAD)